MLVSMGLESVLSKGTSWPCAACHSLFLLPGLPGTGDRGTGGGQGLPLAQTGQQGMQGPATKALPARKAVAVSSWVSRQTPA